MDKRILEMIEKQNDIITKGFAEMNSRLNIIEELTEKLSPDDVRFLRHKIRKLEEDICLAINKNQ